MGAGFKSPMEFLADLGDYLAAQVEPVAQYLNQYIDQGEDALVERGADRGSLDTARDTIPYINDIQALAEPGNGLMDLILLGGGVAGDVGATWRALEGPTQRALQLIKEGRLQEARVIVNDAQTLLGRLHPIGDAANFERTATRAAMPRPADRSFIGDQSYAQAQDIFNSLEKRLGQQGRMRSFIQEGRSAPAVGGVGVASKAVRQQVMSMKPHFQKLDRLNARAERIRDRIGRIQQDRTIRRGVQKEVPLRLEGPARQGVAEPFEFAGASSVQRPTPTLSEGGSQVIMGRPKTDLPGGVQTATTEQNPRLEKLKIELEGLESEMRTIQAEVHANIDDLSELGLNAELRQSLDGLRARADEAVSRANPMGQGEMPLPREEGLSVEDLPDRSHRPMDTYAGSESTQRGRVVDPRTGRASLGLREGQPRTPGNMASEPGEVPTLGHRFPSMHEPSLQEALMQMLFGIRKNRLRGIDR